MSVNEDTVEQAALEWFDELGCTSLAGSAAAGHGGLHEGPAGSPM